MSSASAYNYASTAPARTPRQAPRPERSFRVLPGKAERARELSPVFLLAAKIVVVAVILLTGLSFARIALNSATVAWTLESQELSASVDSARAEASTLEIQQSALANPERIKTEAATLGMAAPVTNEIITVAPDVVATDGQGALSLSGSVANLVQAG